jgi:hypothetical protein
MGISFDANFEFISQNNSSTANLSAGASFVGTADDLRNADAILVSFLSTQNCTLVLEQSTNGTNWDVQDTFTYSANSGFSTSVSAISSSFRIRVTNNGAIATTSLRLQTQYSSGVAASPRSLGQKAMVESLPVAFASDQTALDVNIQNNPQPSPNDTDFSFGTVTTVVTTEVLIRRATYTEQTTNAQRSIVSSSTADASAGTGVRTVLITYHDQTGAGPFTETITMNGTTAVNTVASNICYIDNLEAITVGSSNAAAGNIQLRSTTAGGGVTIKQISTGDLQSYDAVIYVSAGDTVYVTGISCSHNGTTVGSGGVFRLRKQTLNASNQPLIQVSDFVRLYGQSSTFSRVYQSPIKLVGPAKLELWVAPETTSSTIYRGSFDYFTM